MDKMITLYPIIMKILLGLIIALIMLNLNQFKKVFGKVKKETWLILLAIFLVGLSIRLFLVPKTHHMYFDEFEHNNIAQNILYSGSFCECYYGNRTDCNICLKPGWFPGYPTILSLLFSIFGDSEATAYAMNTVIGSLSIIMVFFLIYLLYKRPAPALFGALMFSLIPVHLRFSGGTSLEIMSVFFTLLSMVFLEVHLIEKRNSSFLLFLSALLFTVQVRTENFLLIGLFFVYILIKKGRDIIKVPDIRDIASITSFGILLIPAILHLRHGIYNSYPLVWNVSLATRFGYLRRFFLPSASSLVNPSVVPLALVALLILGCIRLWKKDKMMLAYLWVFLLSFFLTYAASSNGLMTPDTGNIKYTLMLYIPAIIMAVSGYIYLSENIRISKSVLFAVSAVVFIASVIPCLGIIRTELWGMDEYRFILAIEDLVPDDVYVIAPSPASFISTIHKNSISSNEFIVIDISEGSPFGRHKNVLLFKDIIWHQFMKADEKSMIESKIDSTYDSVLIKEEGIFSLYNLTRKI